MTVTSACAAAAAALSPSGEGGSVPLAGAVELLLALAGSLVPFPS
jgi:hypothetical protein